MPGPIRRINELLRELERHKGNHFIKVITEDGNPYIIRRIRIF